MKKVILLLFIFIPITIYCQKQKKVLIDSKDQIIENAIKELDLAMASSGRYSLPL